MYNVFVDFDGVLAACMPTAEKLLGKSGPTSKEFWSVANHPTFFLDLPVLPDANELMLELSELRSSTPFRSLKALTATGNNFVEVGKQKRAWAEKHFFFHRDNVILVRQGTDKAVYASPHNILIDDTPKVIEAWESSGGIGILHTDAKSTIVKLKNIVNSAQIFY